MGTTRWQDFPRDRFKQPLIVPPGGGERVPYSRVTEMIDVLDPRFGLEWWSYRQILKGIQLDWDSDASKDLWKRILTASREIEDYDGDDPKQFEKDRLHPLISQAKKASFSGQRAANGTRIHALTEAYDRGEKLPEDASDSDLRDLAAYIDAMQQLGATCVEIEKPVIVDEFRSAGTMDRALDVLLPGFARRIIAASDIKTGEIQFGNGKLAMQLAAYANGDGFDADDETARIPLGVDRGTGLLIHLPQGTGTCHVYLVDLRRGLAWLRIARAVNDYRDVSGDARADDALVSASADENSVKFLRAEIEASHRRKPRVYDDDVPADSTEEAISPELVA